MDHPLYLPRPRRPYRRPTEPERWGARLHPPLHQSLLEFDELALVSEVLANQHERDRVLNVKDINARGAHVAEQVDFALFDPRFKGDVDVLVIPEEHPEHATAIQVKRLAVDIDMGEDGHDKYYTRSLSDPLSTKHFDLSLEELHRRFSKLVTRGAEQANLTKRLGFAQVYLWTFVLIDSRKRNNGLYTYDGADANLSSVIRQVRSTFPLDPNVGLLQFEWTQPIDRAPFQLGTSGGSLDRAATRTPQSEQLTERLKALRAGGQFAGAKTVKWSDTSRVVLADEEMLTCYLRRW